MDHSFVTRLISAKLNMRTKFPWIKIQHGVREFLSNKTEQSYKAEKVFIRILTRHMSFGVCAFVLKHLLVSPRLLARRDENVGTPEFSSWLPGQPACRASINKLYQV